MTEYEYYMELTRNKNKLARLLKRYETKEITFEELQKHALVLSCFIADDYNFYRNTKEENNEKIYCYTICYT